MSEPLNLSGRDPAKTESPANKPSRVERLQQKLYSPNAHFEMKPRQELQEKKFLYESGWEKGNKNDFAGNVEKQKLSIFAKLAIVAFIFFIGAMGYAFYIFSGSTGNVAGSEVELTVISPVSAGGGEELVLDVIVENKNNIPIYTVDLVIEYPDGTKAIPDLRTNLPRIRDGLGDLQPGQIVKGSYSAALFGEEGDSKEVNVRVEYKLPGSTTTFEQQKKVTIALQSSPIRLLVNAVKEITAQQELVFDVTLASNSNQELRNVIVNVQYPFGFTVTESSRQPSDRNNVWRFDVLKPQEEITFQVKGRLEGQNKEERVFTWNAGIAEEGSPNQIGVAFTKIQKGVSIAQPFLALNLAIDGDTSADIVRPGGAEIEGRLTYINNTGAAINDARISLKLDGDVLQDSSVQVGNGFYNSTDNTITWDSTSRPELRQIPVGGRETLLFRFSSKPLATRSAVFKNPEVIIDARVTGRRLAEDNVPENVESQTVSRVKFLSATTLTAVTSRGTNPFNDTGPIPPRVEQETTYTVTLALTNSSNLLSGGKVTATLPAYMRWNNQVSPGTERVSFDPVTRQVEWNLGEVREHVGFIDPARKVSMQLTLVPSASQAGAAPTLLTGLIFEGQDTFTNTQATAAPREMPNTDLGAIGGQESGKVVE